MFASRPPLPTCLISASAITLLPDYEWGGNVYLIELNPDPKLIAAAPSGKCPWYLVLFAVLHKKVATEEFHSLPETGLWA